MKTILGFFCFSFSIIFCQSANFSYKEIAERLDLSVKAIEKRMNVALSHLKKDLRINVGQ